MKDCTKYEQMRRKVWSNVWAMTANATDCKSPDTATRYADAALQAFDERFGGATQKYEGWTLKRRTLKRR